MRILRQFHHPLIYVLLVAGAVTALLHEYVDSAVIFGVVIINAIVGFIQESKAEAALQSLRAMVHTDAKVIRDGRERVIASEQLVPGDLVLVEAGDKVPADIRLLRQAELRVDESALTGESDTGGEERSRASRRDSGRGSMQHGSLGHLGDRRLRCGDRGGHGSGNRDRRDSPARRRATTLATPLTAKLARFSRVLTVGILAWQH